MYLSYFEVVFFNISTVCQKIVKDILHIQNLKMSFTMVNSKEIHKIITFEKLVPATVRFSYKKKGLMMKLIDTSIVAD